MPNIPFIELKGDNRAIGYSHGNALKESIASLYEKYMQSTVKRSFTPTTEKELLQLSMRNYRYAKEYAPDIFEEMLGIAEGAQLEVEKIMFLNCLLEGLDLAYPCSSNLGLKGESGFPSAPTSCTSFGVMGDLNFYPGTLIGQNYDMQHELRDHVALLKIKKNETTLLLFTFAGVVGCQGMNSNKIALAINKLIAKDVRAGVPHAFIARRVLEQKNIVDALRQIISAERASGTNYVLADSNIVIDVETTAQSFDILHAPDNSVTHTNHYKSDLLKKDEGLDKIGASTYIRDAVMYKNIKEIKTKIDMKTAKQLLSDHTGYPYSICEHPPEGLPAYLSFSSVISMICVPDLLKAWFCWGCPCEGEYVEYQL